MSSKGDSHYVPSRVCSALSCSQTMPKKFYSPFNCTQVPGLRGLALQLHAIARLPCGQAAVASSSQTAELLTCREAGSLALSAASF